MEVTIAVEETEEALVMEGMVVAVERRQEAIAGMLVAVVGDEVVWHRGCRRHSIHMAACYLLANHRHRLSSSTQRRAVRCGSTSTTVRLLFYRSLSS